MKNIRLFEAPEPLFFDDEKIVDKYLVDFINLKRQEILQDNCQKLGSYPISSVTTIKTDNGKIDISFEFEYDVNEKFK